MRIVHIITRLIIGGAQENTLLSCEGQHDAGHEVTLLTGPAIGPEGSLIERAHSYGYGVEVMDTSRRAIHPARDWETYQHLVRRLRTLRPDVVHTHSSKAGIIGRWAAHVARVPLIVHTIHGLAFTASTSRLVNGIYKQLERRASRITDRIVCVADAMRDQSLAAGVGEAAQYVTVYSGMETAPFLTPPVPREETRTRLGIAGDEVIVGTIARLFELKGHEDLLAVAPQLCARNEKLKFLWVGDGSLRKQFEEEIDRMGLRGRFILTGMVPPAKVPELTVAMDVLVHPSRREGLARALPQAALAGKPAITYDIDGAKEAVIDGGNGFVIAPFNRLKLADAIDVLVRDEALRRTMGGAGRALALSRFDARTMVEALERVYIEGLNGRPSIRPAGRPSSEGIQS